MQGPHVLCTNQGDNCALSVCCPPSQGWLKVPMLATERDSVSGQSPAGVATSVLSRVSNVLFVLTLT